VRKVASIMAVVGALFALTTLSALAAPQSTATVRFGDESVGSGKNDPGAGVFHDSSFKANDKIRPRTVVISAGGTVDFEVEGFHQVAVCAEGVELDDVAIPAFPPALFVNDPQCPRPAGVTASTSVDFDEPGRYLILCNVTPHLTESGMYSYVIVK
jgi:plastocyanin